MCLSLLVSGKLLGGPGTAKTMMRDKLIFMESEQTDNTMGGHEVHNHGSPPAGELPISNRFGVTSTGAAFDATPAGGGVAVLGAGDSLVGSVVAGELA